MVVLCLLITSQLMIVILAWLVLNRLSQFLNTIFFKTIVYFASSTVKMYGKSPPSIVYPLPFKLKFFEMLTEPSPDW